MKEVSSDNEKTKLNFVHIRSIPIHIKCLPWELWICSGSYQNNIMECAFPKRKRCTFKKLSVKNSASSGIVGNSQVLYCLIKTSTQSLKC